jgi:uncharacterized protein (TIGR03067 family)
MRYLLLPLVGCLLLSTGCASNRGGGEDQKRIQGNWRVELVETGGKASDDPELLGTTISFDEYKIVITVGDTTHEGTFTMDAFKMPRHLDLKPVSGSSDKPMYAIYSFETDNHLRLCFSQKSRPNGFKTAANTDAILFEVKRESGGRASVTVTAEELLKTCKKNRSLAASIYPKEQSLEVTGKVLSSKDGHVCLEVGADGDYVDCAFNRNYVSGLKRAAMLNQGDPVKLRGNYGGTSDNPRSRGTVFVTLLNCEVVE